MSNLTERRMHILRLTDGRTLRGDFKFASSGTIGAFPRYEDESGRVVPFTAVVTAEPDPNAPSQTPPSELTLGYLAERLRALVADGATVGSIQYALNRVAEEEIAKEGARR